MQEKRTCEKIRVLAVIGIIFALIAAIAGGKTTVKAAGAAISVSSVSAEKGDSVKVNVLLSGNPGIWAIKVRVKYDSSALQLTAMSNGGVFNADDAICNMDKGVYVASSNKLSDVTANGNLLTLEFKVLDTAASSYSVSADVEQAKNVSGNDVSVSSGSGSVTVENCIHDKKWTVTKAATCENNGEQKYICSKCGEVFETKEIAATGHKNTEIRNQTEATATKDGYTGDTYCKDCGKKLSSGQTVAKTGKQTDSTKSESNKITTNKTTEKKTDKKSEAAKSATSSKKSSDKSEETVAAQDTAKQTEVATETQTVTETEESTEVKEDTQTQEVSNTKEVTTAKKSKGGIPKALVVVGVIALVGAMGGLLYYFIIRRRSL